MVITLRTLLHASDRGLGLSPFEPISGISAHWGPYEFLLVYQFEPSGSQWIPVEPVRADSSPFESIFCGEPVPDK